MTALLYFLIATFVAAAATRAWLLNRDNPAHIAFLGMGWALCLAHACFALSLLPGLRGMWIPSMLALFWVPSFTAATLERLFQSTGPARPMYRSKLSLSSAVLIPIAFGIHLVWFDARASLSPPLIAAGLIALGTIGYAIWRLLQVQSSVALRVESLRLRYLIGALSGSVGLAFAEIVGRALIPPNPSDTLSISARAFELQGPIPPMSVLLAGVSVLFIYHILVNYRLLDLYEMFSRLATLVLSALALVLVDGVTVTWVDTFTDYPFHSTFQVFLSSILFLAAYDPLKEQIQWWSNRLLNKRGHQLAEALESLRKEVPTVISKEALAEVIVSRLYGSGRVPVSSVYLWDQSRNAYACLGARGETRHERLALVATHPFTDGFVDGLPFYIHSDLKRRLPLHPRNAELLSLMDAMHSDLAIPIRSGNLVLGWVHLQDEEWSDGFSAEEMHRLQHVAHLVSIVLSNIAEYQQKEEEHRLAALGAMAAGLAHEIRNPLAGIKGAAQFLQGEDIPEAGISMLNVVVHEADRLNTVVSQFLEYARPFKLHLATDHINAMTSQVLDLLRAQGVADTIEVVEQLASHLPPLQLDRTKMSQVLINLIRNALQAMGDGGTLTIRTLSRRRRNGEYVMELTVSDTGRGIDDKTREKLFVPFFTTKDDGTGLGLAISQRIVQAHGGEIDLRSRIGRGSTFIIRLPLPPDSVPTREAPTAEVQKRLKSDETP